MPSTKRMTVCSPMPAARLWMTVPDARLVKASFVQNGPKTAGDSYCVFAIRRSDNTVAYIEFIAQHKSVLVVRRVATETVQKPEIAWDLTGITTRGTASDDKPGPSVLANAIILNVSVRHMVEAADFQTYIFAEGPSWAAKREDHRYARHR